MRVLASILPLLTLAAAAHAQQDDTPPPIDSDQQAIIAKAREKALSYGQGLPDFVCNRVTRYNLDPSGTGQQWKFLETVNEELDYTNHQQTFKPVSGKKASETPSDDFGNLMTWIFAPTAKTEFKWSSWANYSKRRTYVFAYQVRQPDSQFPAGNGKSKITIPFGGLVWIDVETSQPLRVAATGQTPKGFSVQSPTIETLYDFVKVGDREVVLPTKSDYRSKEGKSLVWNETEFRKYRKPGA